MNATLAASLLFLAQAGPPAHPPSTGADMKLECMSPSAIVMKAEEFQQRTGQGELMVLRNPQAQAYVDFVNEQPPPTNYEATGVLLWIAMGKVQVWIAVGPFACGIGALDLKVHAKALERARGRAV
jgi:hypothetical protein